MNEHSQIRTPPSDEIIVARHFETAKNVFDIHGKSDLAELTADGQHQLARLVRRLQDRSSAVAVVATPTPQATHSGRLLASSLGLPYEGELSLAPANIGVASGKSTDTFRTTANSSFRSLDLFRARVIDVRDLQIDGGESASDIELRLIRWWETEGKFRCPGRIVVGSNSTVLMIANLLQGHLPTSGRYKALGTPNGSMKCWKSHTTANWVASPPIPKVTWPENYVKELKSKLGSVAVSGFAPSWDVVGTVAIIIPGYFGSSRHGPYGLYTRLAREWAYEGFLTVTVDMLGTGDSAAVARDFESELESVMAVTDWLSSSYDKLILVGHSMGAATALAAREANPTACQHVWCLTPLCTLEDLSIHFFSPAQLDDLGQTGRTTRHGLELRLDMIMEADDVWRRLGSSAEQAWLAGADPYTAGQDLTTFPPIVQRVDGADHNFSTGNSAAVLTQSTKAALWETVGNAE